MLRQRRAWARRILAWSLIGLLGGCASFEMPTAPVGDVTPSREARDRRVVETFERKRDRAEYEAALAQLDYGNLDRGEASLSGLLKRSPEHIEARLRLAEVYMATNRLDEAFDQLQRALTLASDRAETYHAMAMLLDASNQPSGALVYYRRATELEPENELFSLDYETSNVALPSLPSQAETGGHALSPVNCRASYISRSSDAPSAASADQASSPAAADPLQESISPDRPDKPDALQLPDEAQPLESETSANTASSDRTATKPSLRPAAGLTFHGSPDSRETVKTAKAGASSARGSGARLSGDDLGRAEYLFKAGATQAATSLCRRAISNNPDNPQTAIAAATLLVEHEELQAAIRLLDDALRHWPRSASCYRILGVAHYRHGDYAQSVSALRHAVSLDKSNALSYFLLGLALDKVGHREEADRLYHQATRIDPSLPVPR